MLFVFVGACKGAVLPCVKCLQPYVSVLSMCAWGHICSSDSASLLPAPGNRPVVSSLKDQEGRNLLDATVCQIS